MVFGCIFSFHLRPHDEARYCYARYFGDVAGLREGLVEAVETLPHTHTTWVMKRYSAAHYTESSNGAMVQGKNRIINQGRSWCLAIGRGDTSMLMISVWWDKSMWLKTANLYREVETVKQCKKRLQIRRDNDVSLLEKEIYWWWRNREKKGRKWGKWKWAKMMAWRIRKEDIWM